MEETVSCLISCINSTGLPGCLRREASSFLCLEDNWSVLQDKISELRILQDQVEKKVMHETDKGNKCNPFVERWQNKVKDHKEYTQEHYDHLNRCQRLCSCTPNLCRRCSHGKRISKKIQDVTKLIDEGNKFNDFGCKPQIDSVVDKPQTRTFGMESQIIQLFKYFKDPEKRIIGIWGQGGAGKTTLLNRFNNELKKENGDLSVVIMIEVSNFKTLKVADIQRVITDRLGLQWSATEEEDTRAKLLVKALKSKNFVIMLDDVWKAFQVENVGIPFPDEQSNSKLIVASWDKNVCIHMGAQRSLIQMEHLDWIAAWELFQENLTLDAINAINSSDLINKSAMGIARNCGGLPLALNIIGKAVSGLMELEEWRHASKETKVSLVKFSGGKRMLNGLAYSYNKLKREQKQCLLYCTLFPANSSIKKHQLVHYWMAEGLINDPDQGYYIIGHLISACLLQCNDSYSEVKMHHIIREFALVEATKNKFLVQAGMDLVEAPGSEVWNEAATRISLMSNNLKDLLIPPKCEDLLTLLLQNNENLARLDSNFFRLMQCLRVLDLSYTAITELPGCDRLVELQHLNLCHTRIKKLHDFSNLKKLRHLDLSITWCLEDTSDNCSKLLNLIVLNLFRSSCGIRDVDDLNIDTLVKLEFLGIAIHAYAVLNKLNEKHRLATATRRLSLKYCEEMKFVKISDFKGMVNLEELYIESCNDLKQLTADALEQRNSCLRVLTLAVLSNLDIVTVGQAPDNFQNLRDITISECHKLDNVTWVKRLKSLERLVILQCDGMVQVVNETQNDTPSTSTLQPNRDNEIQVMEQEAFPKLRSIILTGLNRLESICRTRYFCCLRSITVEACPKLRRLPVGENMIIKLEQICGSKEWWEKLIWEGTRIKEELDKRFLPI